MLVVKGCQTLVMDPSSLLQQSPVDKVPLTVIVHLYLLGSALLVARDLEFEPAEYSSAPHCGYALALLFRLVMMIIS